MKSIIIYATRYGSTFEVAKRIQKQLADKCTIVNIATEKIPSLDTYDNVILGGSIYIGKVQKKLNSFAVANLEQLLTKRVGLYICAGAETREELNDELIGAFPKELFDHAIAKDVLGYAYAFEKMRFIDRIIIKKIKGYTVSTDEYFEERIWQFANGFIA